MVLKLRHECSCRAKNLDLDFCWPSTNKITCTQHQHKLILHSSCHVQRVLIVATLVITGALIARTVTQRTIIFHHRLYLCLLHWMIRSLIHLSCPRFINSHPVLHRTQLQSHKLLQYLVGLQIIRQIPCHRLPPRTEVAIFMDAWWMCLSWHRNNDNSMP